MSKFILVGFLLFLIVTWLGMDSFHSSDLEVPNYYETQGADYEY
jgi:hypothetical protein